MSLIKVSKQEAQILITMLYFSKAYEYNYKKMIEKREKSDYFTRGEFYLPENPKYFTAQASVIVLEPDIEKRKYELRNLFDKFSECYKDTKLDPDNTELYQKEMWAQSSEALNEEIEYNYATKNGKDKVDAYFLRVDFGVEIDNTLEKYINALNNITTQTINQDF